MSDSKAARVQRHFQKVLRVMLAEGEHHWYARAYASVQAAELAMRIGHPIKNTRGVIRDAGTVAEADCDGTDEEAFAARDGAKARMRARLERA